MSTTKEKCPNCRRDFCFAFDRRRIQSNYSVGDELACFKATKPRLQALEAAVNNLFDKTDALTNNINATNIEEQRVAYHALKALSTVGQK